MRNSCGFFIMAYHPISNNLLRSKEHISMNNRDNDTSAIHEESTGESSNKISKKENRIITIIMFGVIAPLLLIAQHYYDAIVEFLSEHISRYIDEILDFLDKTGYGSL